jgi:hypothetical protein
LRLYNDRAGIELIIRQLKGEYGVGEDTWPPFLRQRDVPPIAPLAYNLVKRFRPLEC